MPGIFKKFKTIMKLVKDHAPKLNYFIPGLGTVASMAANVIDKGGDAVNRIHTDYTASKKAGRKYGFKEGLASGVKGVLGVPVEMPEVKKERTKSQAVGEPKIYKERPIHSLSRSINDLDERIQLRRPIQESDIYDVD
jgi:hypothetical protein